MCMIEAAEGGSGWRRAGSFQDVPWLEEYVLRGDRTVLENGRLEPMQSGAAIK